MVRRNLSRLTGPTVFQSAITDFSGLIQFLSEYINPY